MMKKLLVLILFSSLVSAGQTWKQHAKVMAGLGVAAGVVAV